MAIYRLLKFSAFQSEEITCMTAAYEDALRVLQLSDRQDPITEIVAKKSSRRRRLASVTPGVFGSGP